MLYLQNLSIKEKIYLTELANTLVNPPISPDTLNSLKPGVLQHALTSLPNLDSRKVKILNKILDKINYYGILKEGELAPAKIFLENKQEENK
ncbi:hypothetical protein [Flavobacterium sp.]|uniref:hypothetical protein n=1 Tax=Flavobacterium sp. TaxID=239 RepID=UPI0038FCB876